MESHCPIPRGVLAILTKHIVKILPHHPQPTLLLQGQKQIIYLCKVKHLTQFSVCKELLFSLKIKTGT